MACKVNYKGNSYSKAEFQNYVIENSEEFVDKISPELISDINTNKFVTKNSSQGVPGDLSQKMRDLEEVAPRAITQGLSEKYGVRPGTEEFSDVFEREMIDTLFNKRGTPEFQFISNAVSQDMVGVKYDSLSPAVKSLYDTVTGTRNVSNMYPVHNDAVETVILDSNNEFRVINKSEIQQNIDSQTGINLLLDERLEAIMEGQYGQEEVIDMDLILSEPEKSKLQDKLLGILENLGVSTVSMKEYLKNYKQKHGIDPSVEALSDITQRVVALAETGDTTANLTEEVSHFLVEAYKNQDEITLILPSVESSQEWAESSSQYYTLYENKGFTGEQLTEKVRREILGKIVANSILSREETPMYKKALKVLSDFMDSIRGYFSPSIKTSLDTIVDRITTSALAESQFNNTFSSETLSSSNFDIFYSAVPSTMTTNLATGVTLMQKQLAILQKEGTGKGLNLRMDTLRKHVEASDTLKAVSTYLDMVDTLYTDVNRKVKNAIEAEKKGLTVGPILMGPQAASADILTTENLAHLSTLKDNLVNYEFTNPQDKKIAESLVKKLNLNASSIQALSGELKNLTVQRGEEMMSSLMEEFRLPEAVQEAFRQQMNAKIHDTNMLMAKFGNMQNASNPILLLLSKMINKMYTTVRNKDLKVYNALTDKLKSLGVIDKLDSFVQKTSDGKLTNYFSSVIDHAKFDAEFNKEKVRLYNEALATDPTLTGLEPITELSEIGTKGRPNEMDLPDVTRRAYNEQFTQWLEDNTETPFNGSFKKMREDMFTAIENGVTLPDGSTLAMVVPDMVKQQMAEWARRRREIKEPYITNGNVDYTLMSESEREELVSIKKERKAAASMIDPSTLEEKTGPELEIAKAYQAMNGYYSNLNATQNKRGVTAGFFTSLANFTKGKTGAELSEANRQAFEFFNKNAGLNFNEKFWEAVKSSNLKASAKVAEFIKDNPEDLTPSQEADLIDSAAKLEKYLSNRSGFLKAYSNPSNPAEIDVDSMAPAMLNSFKDLEQEIETLYTELNSKLITAGGVGALTETESTANEAYLKVYEQELKLQPSLTEMDFMMGHMTVLNKNKVALFNSQYRDYMRTGIIPITGNFKFVVTKQLGLDPKATNGEIEKAIKAHVASNGEALDMLFAKSKLLGYFKRFAPKGFSEFYDMLKSGEIVDKDGQSRALSEVIQDIENGKTGTSKFEFMSKDGKTIALTKYLNLNAEVEWMEDQNPFTNNPNYIKNAAGTQHMGGSRQPKISKYKNEEFIQKYNVDMQVYKNSGKMVTEGTSPERKNELEGLSYIIENRFEALKQQGLQNVENSFKRPQVRKSSLEQSAQFATGNFINTTKNMLRDSWSNTVDKMMYGETVDGDINSDGRQISNLAVPVLNVRNIEDINDVTEDVLYGLMTHTHNAHLYSERQKVMAKSNQLEQLMLNKQKFSGKEAKNTRAHEWYQEYIKINVLGVSELNKVEIPLFGRKVNLTNFLRSFDAYQGLINVGLNPAVSITSGTSALTFSATEAILGDYIPTESYKYGGKRFMANQAGFLSETGKVEKKSEVYLFGEKFGLFNLTERLNGSKYNQALRAVFKDGLHGAAHSITEMMTHPFAPTAMYGVMHDFRYVPMNGTFKLMNFSDFKADPMNSLSTKKELENAWKAFEDNSIAKNATSDNGRVDYTDNFKNIWESMYQGDAEKISEEMDYMENEITSGTQNLVSKVDAKMPMYDKSTASRNALLRFALRHREWFTINLQNRWKGEHYNLNTHKYEEGSYISMSTFLRDIYQAFSFKGGASNLKEFQNIYAELDGHQQSNLKRVLVDVAISALLITLGTFVVSKFVDDEDNKDSWAIQYAGYLYFRLASEQMSAGLAGIPQSKDVLESPFVAVNSMKELLKPSNYTFDEVEGGAYEGHSKLFKLIAKQTFARHYYDTVPGLTQKTDFFRLNNEWTLWGMGKISKKEKEEQAEYRKQLSNTFSTDRAGMR